MHDARRHVDGTELKARGAGRRLVAALLIAVGGTAGAEGLAAAGPPSARSAQSPPVEQVLTMVSGNQGPAVEPKSGRTFFLDYPCDLKPGEKVTFILNLHGGGSVGNWQRHYFPAVDLKDSVTAKGHICLQVHGVGKKEEPLEVAWRNIKIKVLDKE